MSTPSSASSWEDAEIEALLSPLLGGLAPPTSLSPLPFDLNAGVPDRASLPAEELAGAFARAIRADPGGALTYGGQQGFEGLRAWIAASHAKAMGLELTSEQVTLCSGSAQALDNIAATFVGPGDVVAVGAPTYPGAIRAFRARGAELAVVPQDGEGLRVDALEEELGRRRAAGTPVKLVYLIPTYDNPTGATMPLDRRRALVEVAAREGALIVEDDAYARLDFEGAPPPSLFELAGGRGVLYVGTFSKTIATGLRVGWVLAEPSAIGHLVFARLDNGASPLVQRAVLEYLEGGTHEAHVARLQALYRERRDAAASALSELASGLVRFEPPAGGFYLWLELAGRAGSAEAAAAAREQGVAVTPGAMYFPSGGGERHLRLAFPAEPPERLREAVRRLAAGLEAAERAAG